MTPPNVILIHGHDIGRWLSVYGLPSVPSPHLAALAEQSVVFDQAFSTAPLCTPARSSLFTGLSPHVNGLMGLAHDHWRYRRSVATLPEMLHEAGYHTALIGLQHEHPDPTVLGFDEVGGMGFLPRALPVAETAAEWLANRPDQGRPFFLTVGIWEAHRPWCEEDYVFAAPDEVEVPPYLPDNPDTRQDLAGFYGAIRQFDRAIGLLMDSIDRYCDPANTMVIVTTDHGAAFPRAKSTLYDPGVGVFLIVRPPAAWAVAPGRRNHQASHLDIAPTLLETAGATVPDRLEGHSLVGCLRDRESGADERTLYFEKTYHDGYDPIRAVRTTRWKYIRNFTDGPRLPLALDLEQSLTRRSMGDAHLAPRPGRELYDLHRDPWELENLVDDPTCRDVADHLDGQLLEWMRRTHDPLLAGSIAPASRPSRWVDAADDLPADNGAPTPRTPNEHQNGRHDEPSVL